ncbi:MAG: hypothetical protein KIT56_10540 [Gammaproteobacteria bacterium]|nr:hypothetical protein [Gammaproteobacteria bacterium]
MVVGILTGCGPVYKREYAFVPPRTGMGKMCIAQCVQNKNTCEQMCQMNNENCRLRAHQDAVYQFEMYKHERRKHGAPVKKDVSDFDMSYTCNHSCNCEPTYRSCYSACGGQVLERDVCVAFCDKK